MSRPRVIVSVVATVDGRVALNRTSRLLDPATRDRWLAFLRTQEIPYLSAGADRVDLAAMLALFGDRLGASTVVSEAGGGLNGALLRAGLVDELHLITVPALVGGLGTPSVMDGPPLADLIGPTRLRTVDVQLGEHGSIWSHYEVL